MNHNDRAAPHALGLGLAATSAAAAAAMIAGCVIFRARDLAGTSAAPPALLLRTAFGAVLLLATSVTAAIILSA
ncbi:hypothetical protein ABLI39_02480 [Pseudarthrobacter sp. B907]|uniref:hypothetical protein n=1 Tax=Pseudarthrobacter sp. B907 TaxID=3158261 RepID=UPI0032DA6095